MTVDGLGADAVLRVLQFHPPGDLLGRPSHGKAVLDAGAQVGGTLDLRASQLARPGPPVGAVRAIGVDASVPHDLSVDRRTVTPKAPRDLTEAKTHLHQAAQTASLLQTEVAVSRSHGDPGHSRCRTWFVDLATGKMTKYQVNCDSRMARGRP